MPRMNKSKRVRREDVAAEAGVSSATVSYVLNGTKRLSQEVERRVMEAARKLNYMPDRIAQSLAGSKTRTIAYMTADITNTYQLEVIKGLQKEALKHDYVVYIFDASGDVDRYIENVISRRVDGIYVSTLPDFMSDELLCKLRDAGIKVLTDFSRNTYLPDISYITSDRHDGFMQAVRYLRELGHTEIGYLSAFDESCYYDVRLAAYRVAMSKQFPNPNMSIVFGEWPYSTSERPGGELMKEMMERYPQVTAVIATNDIMAIGAIKAVTAAGKSVPGDYSVIGIDNIAKSETCYPPLTTIDQNGYEFGQKIFQVLYDNIMNDTSGKYIIPMKLIVRRSTDKLAEKKEHEGFSADSATVIG